MADNGQGTSGPDSFGNGADADTEGPRGGPGGSSSSADARPDGARGGPGGRLPAVGGSDEDTEGHLYTGGPSTQGEFAKRGPGENPHGER